MCSSDLTKDTHAHTIVHTCTQTRTHIHTHTHTKHTQAGGVARNSAAALPSSVDKLGEKCANPSCLTRSGTKVGQFMRCGSCKERRYCSQHCQVRVWSTQILILQVKPDPPWFSLSLCSGENGSLPFNDVGHGEYCMLTYKHIHAHTHTHTHTHTTHTLHTHAAHALA